MTARGHEATVTFPWRYFWICGSRPTLSTERRLCGCERSRAAADLAQQVISFGFDHIPTHHAPMRVSGCHDPQGGIIDSTFTFMMGTEGAEAG